MKTLYVAVFGGLKSWKKSLNTEKSKRAVSKAYISDILRDLEIWEIKRFLRDQKRSERARDIWEINRNQRDQLIWDTNRLDILIDLRGQEICDIIR